VVPQHRRYGACPMTWRSSCVIPVPSKRHASLCSTRGSRPLSVRRNSRIRNACKFSIEGWVRSYCAFAVPTFVPAQAVFPVVLPTKIAFGVRKILIDNDHANDLRIRNAWVRGSNPLCGTKNIVKSITYVGQASRARLHCAQFCTARQCVGQGIRILGSDGTRFVDSV
jgi:hypothetical protein